MIQSSSGLGIYLSVHLYWCGFAVVLELLLSLIGLLSAEVDTRATHSRECNALQGR